MMPSVDCAVDEILSNKVNGRPLIGRSPGTTVSIPSVEIPSRRSGEREMEPKPPPPPWSTRKEREGHRRRRRAAWHAAESA